MTVTNKNEFSRPVRVGIGGPVGSGKTMLTLRLCEVLRDKYSMVAITNDIYTVEDAQFWQGMKLYPKTDNGGGNGWMSPLQFGMTPP